MKINTIFNTQVSLTNYINNVPISMKTMWLMLIILNL
jgi:hypothetical protein